MLDTKMYARARSTFNIEGKYASKKTSMETIVEEKRKILNPVLEYMKKEHTLRRATDQSLNQAGSSSHLSPPSFRIDREITLKQIRQKPFKQMQAEHRIEPI
jgi:hypothetical protein